MQPRILLVIIALALCAPVWAAKCKVDGAWYDYSDPICNQGPFQSDTAPEQGNNDAGYRITGESYFGCMDRKFMDTLTRMAVQKDTAAFNKALTSGILAGRCILFKRGERVFITESSWSSGLTKLRREGDIASYWANAQAIR